MSWGTLGVCQGSRRGPVAAASGPATAAAASASDVEQQQQQQQRASPRRLLAALARPFSRRKDAVHRIVTRITREAEWAALQSRWRFAAALTFYVGFPLHLLSRVWAPLLLNMAIACVVAADHITRAMHGVGFLPEVRGAPPSAASA
jgi:hypothetical protein